MPVALPAVELLPPGEGGRRFVGERVVRLGDVDPRGQLRLDAIARMLQDVAADDVAEARLDGPFGWVVRRTLVDVRRPAQLGEQLVLTTYCTGTGRCWAERRTSVTGAGGASIEAVSLWVQVDEASGRPTELTTQFHETYGDAAAGRRVSTRLSLPAPVDGAAATPWHVRAADLDVLAHVNNAVHWAFVEEAISVGVGDRRGVGEVEYLAPVDAASSPTLLVARSQATLMWLEAGGRVLAAARWTPAPGAR